MAATSKFEPVIRAQLVESFTAGCSVPEAAKAVGVTERTLKSWLTRGRKDEHGPYAEFVAAVDAAREAAKAAEGPMDAEEHLLVVSRAARRGSVTAMKLLWEMLRSQEREEPAVDPFAEFDELASRRASAA